MNTSRFELEKLVEEKTLLAVKEMKLIVDNKFISTFNIQYVKENDVVVPKVTYFSNNEIVSKLVNNQNIRLIQNTGRKIVPYFHEDYFKKEYVYEGDVFLCREQERLRIGVIEAEASYMNIRLRELINRYGATPYPGQHEKFVEDSEDWWFYNIYMLEKSYDPYCEILKLGNIFINDNLMDNTLEFYLNLERAVKCEIEV